MLEIISAASEFDQLPMRPGEEEAVRKLLSHAVVAAPEGVRFTDPHAKVNALMQAHFSRTHVAGGCGQVWESVKAWVGTGKRWEQR